MSASHTVTPQRPPRWREVFRGRRGRLAAGLLLLEALAAVQALMVITILPDVRDDLGMVQLYGLVFTASSLATLGAIPITGRSLDRYGPTGVLPTVLILYLVGAVVAATAPAMPVLLLGQFILGAAAGGLYALSLGAVAKVYPDELRPRVMALLATMWILPGLVGPPLGALIASTVGWRWAYVAPIPVLGLGWLLIGPALDLVPSGDDTAVGVAIRWPLQLMVGAGFVFTSLTIVHPWTLAMLGLGLAIGLPALRRIVPPGTFRAAPGAPAAAASAFLLSMGFLAMDAFLTLMLTDVRELSLAAAGAAITVAAVTWAAGSAWQSGRAQRVPLAKLVTLGTILVLVGEITVATTLWTSVPVAAAYVGWGIVGAGMGITFPTLPLATMRISGAGEEASELSSILLMDMLGVATGAGLGGGAIAVATARDASLTAGLVGAFAIGGLALVALLVTGRRIDPARLPDATEG
jgi:MFS family permease